MDPSLLGSRVRLAELVAEEVGLDAFERAVGPRARRVHRANRVTELPFDHEFSRFCRVGPDGDDDD